MRMPGSILEFDNHEEWQKKALSFGAVLINGGSLSQLAIMMPEGSELGDWDDYEGHGIINLEVLA